MSREIPFDDFVERYKDHIEQQEEILVRDDPSLQGIELQMRAVYMTAAKLGITLID